MTEKIVDWDVKPQHNQPREMLKPEPERPGFQHAPKGPADLNVSEKRLIAIIA